MLRNSYYPDRSQLRRRRHQQMASMQRAAPNVQNGRGAMKRSRTVLTLLELFGLGSIGADRFYMGSYKLGALKIALLFLGILAGIFLLGPLALAFFLAYFAFVICDYLLVIWSAITKNKKVVFSGIETKRTFQWIGGQDDSIAMVIAVISIVLTVVNTSLIPVFTRA